MFKSKYRLLAASALFLVPVGRFWIDPPYYHLAPLILAPIAIGAILSISEVKSFWRLQIFSTSLLLAICLFGQATRLFPVSIEFLILFAYTSYLPAQLIVFIAASFVFLMPWRYAGR
jgi:hypothetical protein